MTRNLKALGLVLTMALTIGCLAAAPASAQEEEGFLTAEGPVTLVMPHKEVGNIFTTLNEKMDCPGSVYTGHKVLTTPHQLVPDGANTITVTPHYKNCVANGKKVTVTMNGCDFELEVTVPKPGMFRLRGFIVCPKGKSIVEHVYASATSESLKVCEITTGEQELSGTPTIKEAESGDLSIEGAFTGVHYVSSGLCGSSTSTSGAWELNVDVEGLNEGGSPTNISLSE